MLNATLPMMQLLKKQDVDKAKQIERQQEIEQGKILAKKVDTLRETLADEEQSLTQYRNKTIQAIQGEINAKIAEKDELVGEIRHQKLELARLMQPLDAKWAEVKYAQSIVSKREDVCTAREDKNDTDYRTNLVEAQQNNKKARELARREEDISKSTAQSGKILEEADRILLSNKRNLAHKEEGWVERDKEYTDREIAVLARENEVKIQTDINLASQIENDLERIRLADMRATLERAFKRLK